MDLKDHLDPTPCHVRGCSSLCIPTACLSCSFHEASLSQLLSLLSAKHPGTECWAGQCCCLSWGWLHCSADSSCIAPFWLGSLSHVWVSTQLVLHQPLIPCSVWDACERASCSSLALLASLCECHWAQQGRDVCSGAVPWGHPVPITGVPIAQWFPASLADEQTALPCRRV